MFMFETGTKKELRISFDISTIDNLGVKLYSTIPPMLAELVANAWDADAHNVWINLSDNEKCIEVRDDGCGMSFDELNDKFLKVGRNRRVELNDDKTEGGRPVLGKKGVGKLSMFGIGKKIIVTSVKEGKITKFELDYDKIKSEGSDYKPEIIEDGDTDVTISGTDIQISNISRKSDFDLEGIENGLRQRFHIFSKDFVVHINDEILIDTAESDEKRYQFTWKFPDDFIDLKNDDLFKFAYDKNVRGHIYTSQTPLRKDLQGIVLFSRGKLVQEGMSFSKRGNDNFFQYMTGSFDVDFIDENNDIDNCSTDRKSLAWDNFDNDDLDTLREFFEKLVNETQKKWRGARRESKEHRIAEKGQDVREWIKTLNKAEQPLATKLTEAIIDNDSISDEVASEYMGFIKDMYGFRGFQDYAAKLDEMNKLSDEDAIKLLTDWDIIEQKEYAKIATGRISTIEQFEKYVKEDASETKVIQKFLEEFPWLLDPKMTKFEREVTYSRMLKEKFPDDEKPEHNRRLDFFCTNDSGEIHIIELKRPSIKITGKELQQIAEYVEFVENKAPGNKGHVKGYLISDNMSYEDGARKMANGMEKDGIYVKSYTELLAQARNYNKKLYESYQKIEEVKNDRLKEEKAK